MPLQIGRHIEKGHNIDEPHLKFRCRLMYSAAVFGADLAHFVIDIVGIMIYKYRVNYKNNDRISLGRVMKELRKALGIKGDK